MFKMVCLFHRRFVSKLWMGWGETRLVMEEGRVWREGWGCYGRDFK